MLGQKFSQIQNERPDFGLSRQEFPRRMLVTDRTHDEEARGSKRIAFLDQSVALSGEYQTGVRKCVRRKTGDQDVPRSPCHL
jgi:hypothetical protein